MELKIRYENGYQTINLNTEDTKKMWVSLSLEGEGLSQEEKESRIQEAFEEQFNRPEYNNWHKETRHIDPTPKRKRMDGRRGYICGEKDDDSFDIMDYLAVTYPKCGVYDEEDETAKMYESVLELIQEKVKPDFVDTFIAITSKRTTPKQIASKRICLHTIMNEYRNCSVNIFTYPSYWYPSETGIFLCLSLPAGAHAESRKVFFI